MHQAYKFSQTTIFYLEDASSLFIYFFFSYQALYVNN